ncbi:MAG: hypothetical protein JRI23_25985 [Deltaproteobacteria bacterium]|nr:hypothetical protein [Deltaproteobacteria bacterium]MBW2535479.1 hypothetical protein [Deltaproteobacteria bacterium]
MGPEPMLIVAGAALVGLLLWWIVRYAIAYGRRVDAAWRVAAEQLRGEYEPRAGPWYNRVRRIDAELDGTAVAIDHYTVSTGKSSQVFTRLTAAVTFPGKLKLRVYPKHALSGLADALGFQDVPTGDADFDERFVVKANDEDLARSWLSPRVRQALRKTTGYSFTIKNGKLTAQRSGLELEPQQLTNAAEAAAEVAAAGRHLLERWEHFARGEQGVLGAGGGRPRIEIDERGVPLRIDTAETRDGNTVTRVRARILDPEAERYELRLDEEISDGTLSPVELGEQPLPARFALASSEPEQTARRLTDTVRRRVARLEPAGIESDGDEVVVVLRGMESDEARLRTAMDVASSLAAEAGRGPYR